MRYLMYTCLFFFFLLPLRAQMPEEDIEEEKLSGKGVDRKTYYGIASYYADKFNGRPTANGEIYSSEKFTAACNVLPLGTWIRVTNLRNNRFVIVKTNDRLHPRMKRIVDLSKVAALKLAYIGRGLTQVKVEVLERRTAAK